MTEEEFANANDDEIVKEAVEETIKENPKPVKEKSRFTGVYEIFKPEEWEEKSILEKIEVVKPADLVYEKDGVQIYKSDEATVMIKILQYKPLKFEAIYSMHGDEEPEELEEEMDEEVEEAPNPEEVSDIERAENPEETTEPVPPKPSEVSDKRLAEIPEEDHAGV